MFFSDASMYRQAIFFHQGYAKECIHAFLMYVLKKKIEYQLFFGQANEVVVSVSFWPPLLPPFTAHCHGKKYTPKILIVSVLKSE